MAKREEKSTKLIDLPNYEYPINICCPECYRPLYSRNRVDGRCDVCRKDKKVLPVNYVRPVRKKSDEERDEEKRYRDYQYD